MARSKEEEKWIVKLCGISFYNMISIFSQQVDVVAVEREFKERLRTEAIEFGLW